MRLTNISLNNLKRRRTKVLFVVLGLSIAVATVVLLTTTAITTRADIDRKLDEYGANIVVFPKSDALTLSYGGITVPGASYDVKELNEEDAAKIKTIKNKDNISVVAPKVIGAATVEGRKALLVGVNFKDELRLKRWWTVGGKVPAHPEEILLGSEAARIFKRKAGQSIQINSQDFVVKGILKETGGQEDSLVFADLATAQTLLGKPGKLSLIEVSALCSTCPIEEIDRQISAKLPSAKVSALKQVVQSKMNALEQFTNFSIAMSIIIGFIGALIVFITMLASVNERVREIGIFRAIGFRQSHIGRIILLEALITSLVGGIVGYLAGIGLALVIIPRVVELSVPVVVNFSLLGAAILLSVVIGLIGSLYPAIHASRLDPASALRTI